MTKYYSFDTIIKTIFSAAILLIQISHINFTYASVKKANNASTANLKFTNAAQKEGVLMKKIKLRILQALGILCISVTYGCGKPQETSFPSPTTDHSITPPTDTNNTPTLPVNKTEDSAVIPENNTITSQVSKTAPIPENIQSINPDKIKMDSSLLDSSALYREYSPFDGITVFFREGDIKQVVVRIAKENQTIQEASFLWNYDFRFGEPIFKITEKAKTEDFAEHSVLFIALPTKECEAISPVAAQEVCGEWHTVDLTGLKEETDLMDETIAEVNTEFFYIKWETDEFGIKYPVLYTSSGIIADYKYEYPALQNLKQDDLNLVLEDSLHITEQLVSYRRVGINTNQEIVWIGYLFDDIAVQQHPGNNWRAMCSFAPDKYIQYGNEQSLFQQALLSGKLIRLESEQLLDLDGDGATEQISFRGEPDKTVLTITNTTTGEQEALSDECFSNKVWFDSALYAVSLDGTTVSLAVEWHNGIFESLYFYQYKNGKLKYLDQLANTNYTVDNGTDDGRLIFTAEQYGDVLLGNYAVNKSYQFINEHFQEIVPEFYPFLKKTESFLTLKQDISLYKTQNKEETILFPAGCRVIRVGSPDLTEWLLLENADTKEQGWLQMESGINCILPNGSVLDGEELFDGILLAG